MNELIALLLTYYGNNIYLINLIHFKIKPSN